MTIFSFLIGFAAGTFTTAYLAIKKAETHDFTLAGRKYAEWVERPNRPDESEIVHSNSLT